ncbi:MAG: VWA domain-containing protein [Acidimicrobiales bacterium]
MTARYSYRPWDGSQQWGDLDVDELLGSLTDDLLAGGDLDETLRRLLRNGMRPKGGERVMGTRELIERMRKRREELLKRGSPSAEMERIAAQLDEVVSMERRGIDEMAAEAAASGDDRRKEVTQEVVSERRMSLDLLPEGPSGKLEGLRHHDFVSSEARERFERLLEDLRAEMAESYFKGMSEALRSPDKELLERWRNAIGALNDMLECRARGEELNPSFESFMQSYGDLFEGDPSSLDELLEQLAARMAAAEAMWRSLSDEQRAELQAMAASLLDDVDLRWQMDRFASNLRDAMPGAGWGRSYGFSGGGPLPFSQATDAASELAELSSMEELLAQASSPMALSEIDVDAVRRQLGPDAARSLEHLAGLTKTLREAGLVAQRGGRSELTPKGVRRLGQRALADVFSQLRKERIGDHRSVVSGTGHDREETTKPYEHGDPLNIHLGATLRNALARGGPGVPVELKAEDFEIVETEALSRSATVLLVDLSMSMPMRDNFVPAKKMAMALQTLISTRFPRDFLGIVGFSEVAREIKPEELPTAMWDYVYGTNLQHALALGRRMLAHEHGTKQMIVVTDGEPTAHIDDDGEVWFNYPPVRETLQRTMAEVIRTTKAGITINVFALDLERTHYPFVEQIARVNGGRTFYTNPDALGGYVLVDFLRQRRYMRPAG